MAGFTTITSLKTAAAVPNKVQKLFYTKTPSSMTAAIPHSLWLAAGNPTIGTTPTAGLAGAVKCSKSTTGAIQFNNAVAGANSYLMRFGIKRSGTANVAAGGSYYLVDRLAHANVAINQSTGSFSPVIDGTDRLGATEGAQIICEVTSALSGASNSFTLTYTDQDGNSSSTSSVATIASQGADKFAYCPSTGAIPIFVPLASGDRGARTITDWTLDSGTATGNITIALVKILALLPLPLSTFFAEQEYAIQSQNMLEIPDNACLQIIWIPNLSTGADMYGSVDVIQN